MKRAYALMNLLQVYFLKKKKKVRFNIYGFLRLTKATTNRKALIFPILYIIKD